MARSRWRVPAAPGWGAATAVLLLLAGCSAEEEPSSTQEDDGGSSASATAEPSSEPDSTSGPASPTSDPESAMPDETSPIDPTTTAGGLPVGGVSEEVRSRESVKAAMQDLADRVETDVANIVIVGYADVTWPDGSLGCPQPGRVYSQALVPGQQLVLRVSEGSRVAATGPEVPTGLVSYHAGRRGTFTWCPSPRPPLPSGAGST